MEVANRATSNIAFKKHTRFVALRYYFYQKIRKRKRAKLVENNQTFDFLCKINDDKINEFHLVSLF